MIEGFGHTSAVDWWTFGILLYEMLFGCTPFRGRTRDDTFKHIRSSGAVKFGVEQSVSSTAKNLVKKLLDKDPRKRLGSEHGAADIKAHPWYKGKVNWALIRNSKPPIIPNVPKVIKPDASICDSGDSSEGEESDSDSDGDDSDNPWRDVETCTEHFFFF